MWPAPRPRAVESPPAPGQVRIRTRLQSCQAQPLKRPASAAALVSAHEGESLYPRHRHGWSHAL